MIQGWNGHRSLSERHAEMKVEAGCGLICVSRNLRALIRQVTVNDDGENEKNLQGGVKRDETTKLLTSYYSEDSIQQLNIDV